MALTIGSNLFATRVQGQLERTGTRLRSVVQSLSTGSDISLEGDMGVRLALAERLRAQTRVATVALRNANDGISYIATAEAGLQEIQNILTRMAELANQGANTTFTAAQRSALQAEFSALGSEVERISAANTYNSISTISSGANLTIQVGITGGTESAIIITSVVATVAALGIGTTSGSLSYSISGTTSDAAVTSSRLAYSALVTAQDTLLTRRGSLAAVSSRLTSAVSYLSVARENYSAAESNVRDSDTARDLAEYSRLKILQDSQTALLAQANQLPGLILKLLG
jgi:flagellin